MRAVIQRASQGQVKVDDEIVGSIGAGLVVLVGAESEDSDADAIYIADKIAHLRIFEDADGKMNRSLKDVGGQALIVSQFTLLGDARKGRRPTFIKALEPLEAERLCNLVVKRLRELDIDKVATGRFRTDMKVQLINDGPVTILLDSKKNF